MGIFSGGLVYPSRFIHFKLHSGNFEPPSMNRSLKYFYFTVNCGLLKCMKHCDLINPNLFSNNVIVFHRMETEATPNIH